MNKVIKAKWVAALRSGKYRRGREELYDGTGYCCLGVLCKEMNVKFENDASYLPAKAAKIAELPKSMQIKLAKINDGEADSAFAKQFSRYRNDIGASFNSIANWIEKNL